ILAEQQTSGRGRRGRTWFSAAGSGLYASVVLAPARASVDPMRATMILTLAAGVAIAEAVESATALRADLKWPNDLYVSGRDRAAVRRPVEWPVRCYSRRLAGAGAWCHWRARIVDGRWHDSNGHHRGHRRSRRSARPNRRPGRAHRLGGSHLVVTFVPFASFVFLCC